MDFNNLSQLTTPAPAEPRVFYGKVVGTEFSVIQVGGNNGKVFVLWMGHRAHFDSRIPFSGDRVKRMFLERYLI